MGIAYIGGALAGAIGNKLAPWLVSFMSYRSAIQVLGLLLLLAWPFALFVMKDRPEDLGQNPDGDDVRGRCRRSTAPQSLTFAELSRRSSFWLLLVGSAASIGSIASVNFLMKFVFEEQGFTNQAARDQIWSTASFAALIAGDRRTHRRRLARRSDAAQDGDGGDLRAGAPWRFRCYSS